MFQSTLRTALRVSLGAPLLLLPLTLSSCSSAPLAADTGDEGETLVYSNLGDTIPEWVTTPGVEDNEKVRHFTGISRKFSTEADARRSALDDARVQIADYLGTNVKRLVRQVSAYVGASSEILDPGNVSDAASKLESDSKVLGTAGKVFYSQKWQTGGPAPQTYWKVFVSVPLNRGAEYDLAINDLKSQLQNERDEKKQRNIEAAINRLEELKKQGWFDK